MYWFLGNLITNFTSFPPLGMVLVMTAAVGLCEESGLIETLLNEKMKHTLPVLVPYVAAFIGILGNIASDSSAIIIPPMVGLFFLAAGRHPIAGIICGYAAVQTGFTGFGMIIVFIIFSSFINILFRLHLQNGPSWHLFSFQ